MALALLTLAILLGVYGDKSKKLENFSFEIQSPEIKYDLRSLDEKNDEVEKRLLYVPNVHSFTALSIGTEFTDITLTTQNNDKDKANKGKSKVFDIQVLGYKKNYLWEAYYQNYQGLYITEDTTSSDLPSANAWSYGVSVKQFFSKKFDLKKSISNFSYSKKSGRSWIRGLYFNKNKLFSSEGLVPSEYTENFDQLIGLNGIETTNLGFEFGAGGIFNYQNFFSTGLLTAGYQLQEQRYDGITDSPRTITTTSLNVLIGFGYNFNKNHSIGIEGRARTITIPLKDVNYLQGRSISSLYYKFYF